ncbi:RICIN domain-containing protein [Streptomyces melanogenes]|uniref:XRE family transcriptional regulator n=1 Tax=Streptomyces melanogenes TaxID=67326 RepID=A0ABZ1XY06_9ACTN|nr:RICIN domain-containing protein [Streptomyces melanogenes]
MAGVDGQQAGAVKQLARALKELQQRSGRTLRSLEAEVMASDSSLSRYLTGSTVPPWATVEALCRALEVDPAEYRLLWDAANRSQPKPPSAPGPAAAPGPRWRPRLAGTRARGRWAWGAWGAFVGLLLGAVLASSVLLTDSAPERKPPQAQSAAQEAPRGAPASHDEIRTFISRATGNSLDHSLDKGLRLYAPNGMSYQRWTVHPLPDGASQLRNHATGACLDSSGSGFDARACGGAASQKWSLTRWADESVQIRSRTTGACLDDGGNAGLRALPCNRSASQRWG